MQEITFLVYNVENLSSKLKDLSFVEYVSKFDIVVLTETFCDERFDYKQIFRSHEKFSYHAKRLSRYGRNSGGVLLLIRDSLSKYVKEIDLHCENTCAVRVNKRVFNSDKDVLLVASYVVPEGGSLYKTIQGKDGILNLEESLVQFLRNEDMYVAILGDLNSRTGHEQALAENMSNYDPENEWDDDPVIHKQRCSKDSVINNFGRSLLNLCFLLNCVIVNGYCPSDREGHFTFVSPNGCSVDDYVIFPDELFSENSCDLTVGDRVENWHLPVEFTWKGISEVVMIEPKPATISDERIVWSNSYMHAFDEETNSPDFQQCMQDATATLNVSVNESIDIFSRALCGAAACMMRAGRKHKTKQNEWFDNECNLKKNQYGNFSENSEKLKQT